MEDEQVAVDSRVSEHSCQLFDSRESLADAVSAFLRSGFESGDRLLAVVCPESWDSTARHIRRQGLDLRAALATGQLTVLDAAATLATFRCSGKIDRELFANSVGEMVRAFASDRRQLRVYGEMVDLLAAEGDFRGALQLEALWNDLRASQPFVLFCGYSAVHFGDPRVAGDLRLICRAHSHVRSDPRDELATFLLRASSSPPETMTS